MEININTSSNEVPSSIIIVDSEASQDEKKAIPAVPNVKKEIVPKVHRKIKALLQEHNLSKWDEVEVFYGLIEKWVGGMIKTTRSFSDLDLLLLGSHNDIAEKKLFKLLKEKGEK